MLGLDTLGTGIRTNGAPKANFDGCTIMQRGLLIVVLVATAALVKLCCRAPFSEELPK
jgi:hypothetical protein